MTDHTYAGHTLTEIKAAAEGTRGWNCDEARLVGEDEICEFGTELDGEWYPLGTVDAQTYTNEPADDLLVARYIVTANPDTVLAMAARIEYLESAWHVENIERKDAIIAKQESHNCELKARIAELERERDAAVEARREAQMETQLAREARNRSGVEAAKEMRKQVKAARIEGWRAAREQAALVADNLPSRWDGNVGMMLTKELSASIRTMQPPAEWQCAEVATVCEAAPNILNLPTKNNSAPWPHPDGFAGGLTERNNDAKD